MQADFESLKQQQQQDEDSTETLWQAFESVKKQQQKQNRDLKNTVRLIQADFENLREDFGEMTIDSTYVILMTWY